MRIYSSLPGSHDDVLYVVDAATGEPISRIQLEKGELNCFRRFEFQCK
jgi:hypothetical protein